MSAAIEINKLTKVFRVYQKPEGLRAALAGLFHRRYRTVEAVRDLDLRVERGEFVAFLGPNGAGKTTTLKLLSGVLTPTSGDARVLGHVPWRRENAYRRRFALVMGQKNQLWWDLPAAESFRLHQHIYSLPRDEFEHARDQLAAMLSVTHLLQQPVRELSLGERMKMELIAALLHRPEVLFLDEPTIGLDVVAQHAIREFLRDYQQRLGVTIVLTSHYMKDVAALCRRVVVMGRGRVIYDGSLEGIVERFAEEKIITFQFAEPPTESGLRALGELVSYEPPRARVRVDRSRVAEVLQRVLAAGQVVDVSVEDPPLEEIVAELFAESSQSDDPLAVGSEGRQ